ncbi:MAG: DNA-protecting protein DprA [Desulfobacteraceae bacterium]|nr:DNA-protecting protein DprA [Desulfobacteraceae bacterium]
MENLLPWLTLKSVPGIGNLLFNRLLRHFQSPDQVLSASHGELTQVQGISSPQATAIRRHAVPDWAAEEIETVFKSGYHIILQTDDRYPTLLSEIPDPPPFLYVYGRIDSLGPPVAVVGSRNATSYGIQAAEHLGSSLAGNGVTVVSGMARGIDTAAHQGALAGKGKTIAVLGSGLKKIYPAENTKLFHRIAENGAVISEFPLNSGPEPHHFPIRNRIISGMTYGTVVVEAARKSGSLITARLAAEQNREVFAVPGSINSYKSTGTHTLIKQGAKLVEHVQDILEELPFINISIQNDDGQTSGHSDKMNGLTTDEDRVVHLLEPYPMHIDDIIRKSEMAPGLLSSVLLQLEIKGIVQQSQGKLFSIVKDAGT